MHVIVFITGIPLLAMAFAQLSEWVIAVTAIGLLIVARWVANEVFTRICMRIRWVWLSLIIIYLLFTPGEYIYLTWVMLPFTYEGVYGAAMQLLKLFAMLAWVSVLLKRYTAMQLVSGIYQLFSFLGLSPAQCRPIIVRLFLIMQQAHHQTSYPLSEWQMYFQTPEALTHMPSGARCTLTLQPLSSVDKVMLIAMCVLSVYLVLVGH